MSEPGFVLLSAALLAAPVGMKYLLAFQTRQLMTQLRQRERDVQRLRVQVAAAEDEGVVVARALRQVEAQRRHASARKALMAERLEQTRTTEQPTRLSIAT